MPRNRSKQVSLSELQHAQLESLSKSRTEEARRVQRARILLMAAGGSTDAEIASAVSLNKNSVRNTIAKFFSVGMEAALGDLARPGRPAVIDDDAATWVKSVACTKPKDLGYAQELWTIRTLTAHIRGKCAENGHPVLARVSPSKVWSMLDTDDIKPWRITYYLERRDEDFDRKMREVLMVYKEVELEIAADKGSGTVFVSYDEKPGIQATANIAPDLPPQPGNGSWARDYEYERLGTWSLLAGLNLVTGEVVPLVSETHKSSDFIDFLKEVDRIYADADKIKIVLDNHSSHTSKETMRYLAGVPGRFEFVFTPKHGSWLNLVENFFGKMTRVCLKGIRVKTKEELKERIYRYITEVNAVPVVYHWKYKMDEIKVD
jgi:transposase